LVSEIWLQKEELPAAAVSFARRAMEILHTVLADQLLATAHARK
jgi:hypothetical protein